MKINLDTIKQIYEMLDDVTPVDFDCGCLCNEICCTYDDEDYKNEDLVLELLPFEEQMYSEGDWYEIQPQIAEEFYYPDSWDGNPFFLKCKTPPKCDRKLRPIQCRTYPLTPHINEKGELHLIYDKLDYPYTCPLMEEEIPLNPEFIKKTFEAWKILTQDKSVFDLVKIDSDRRYRQKIKFKTII